VTWLTAHRRLAPSAVLMMNSCRTPSSKRTEKTGFAGLSLTNKRPVALSATEAWQTTARLAQLHDYLKLSSIDSQYAAHESSLPAEDSKWAASLCKGVCRLKYRYYWDKIGSQPPHQRLCCCVAKMTENLHY
jgi:hypothetical protein